VKRRPLLRQALAAGLFLGLLALLFGVASSARLEPADFTFNNFTEVSTLDPATVTGVPEGRVMYSIFEGLVVKHPRTLEPLPGMAESWEVSPDGLSYTFHLRADALWTNGDPVVAPDFVYSYERLLNPRTAAQYAYQLWYAKGARAYSAEVDELGHPKNSFDTVGIRAPDAHTLVIELEHPTPFFLNLLSFYPLMPVNPRNLREAQAAWPETWEVEWLRPENIVTNGPYRVVSRRVNDRIRLAKFEQYWDADHVAFRTIDVTCAEHYTTALNLYLTGAVGWIDKIPVNLIPRLLPREDFDPEPYLGSYFYRVNVTRPPFDDPHLRRALALTIDRKAIVEKITKSGQEPCWTLVPPGMAGYTPVKMRCATAQAPPEDYAAAFAADCAEARKILADAGYGTGGKDLPTIELHYNTSEAHRSIAEVIADSWQKNLGLTAKLLNQEWKVYLDTQSGLAYDVSRSAWIGDYVDPNTFLDLFVTGGENNKTGWGNPRYDELIRAAARELDPERRLALFTQAETILMDEVPVLPIYYYVSQNIVAPRLGGFYENLQDDHLPKFWYWMSDEELAERRAAYPPGVELVPALGPPEGLYPPAGRRAPW
jgi:oligopeptide transport system substrate-binding protein